MLDMKDRDISKLDAVPMFNPLNAKPIAAQIK